MAKFFSVNPFVFSDSLPLSLVPSDIVPLGRPGKAEPDFIFYPSQDISKPVYGAIEIKRPDTRLFSERRKNMFTFSSDLEAGVAQAKTYSKTHPLIKVHQQADANFIFLGNRTHAFIIAGLSHEIAETLEKDIYNRLPRLLSKDCQLIPYDTLFEIFHSSLPPKISILTLDYNFGVLNKDVFPGVTVVFPDGEKRVINCIVRYEDHICALVLSRPTDRKLKNSSIFTSDAEKEIGVVYRSKVIKQDAYNSIFYSLIKLNENITFSNQANLFGKKIDATQEVEFYSIENESNIYTMVNEGLSKASISGISIDSFSVNSSERNSSKVYQFDNVFELKRYKKHSMKFNPIIDTDKFGTLVLINDEETYRVFGQLFALGQVKDEVRFYGSVLNYLKQENIERIRF